MAYEISVVAGGEVTASVFNAIAAFFNGASFGSIISLIMAISVPASVIRYMVTRDHNHIVRWFLTYALVPAFLIVPKTDIIIKDMSQPGLMKHVNNVPAGLAFSAYLGSLLQTAVPEVIDAIFHYPNELAYNKTGFMFGSSLYRLSSKVGITDSNLARIWTHYISNCIRPDILLWKKYTFNELAQAPNIFEFLKSHSPSPLNRVTMDIGDYQTCQEALPKIERMFKEDSKINLKYLGVNYYGKNAAREALFLEQSLQGTYSFFTGISRNATDVITQNMAINGIKSGLLSSAASKNATAAAMNYGKAQTDAQSTSMFLQMGHMMQEYLPIIQTILFLLLVVAFIPMVLLAMLPDLSMSVPTRYIGSFFHICSWPVWFTFIHYISLGFLLPFTTGAADSYGGVALSNTNQLQGLHTKFAAIAGYLLVFVPYFSNALLKGMGNMLGTLATSMTSMISSATSAGARAMATGDLQLGNTSINNHSRNNLSANKHDTNYSDMYGRESYHDESGAIVTRNLDGSYTIHAALSKGAVDLTSSSQIAESKEKSAQSAHEKALRHTEMSQQSFNAGLSKIKAFSDHQASGKNTNDDYYIGVSGDQAKDIDTVKRFADRVGQTEAFDYLNSKTGEITFRGDLGAGVHGGYGKGKQGQGGHVGVSGDAKIGLSGSRSSRETASYDNKNSNDISTEEAQAAREAYKRILNTGHNTHANETSSKGKNFMNDLRSDFAESDAYQKQAVLDENEAIRFSDQAQFYKKYSSTVSINENEAIRERIDMMYGSGAGMNAMMNKKAGEDPRMQHAIQSLNAEREKQMYDSWAKTQNAKQIESQELTLKANMSGQKDYVMNKHQANNAQVPEAVKGETGFDKGLYQHTLNNAHQRQTDIDNKLDHRKQSLLEDREKVQSVVKKNIDTGEEVAKGNVFRSAKTDVKPIKKNN